MWRISKNSSWYWFDCKCFFGVDTKHKIILYIFFIHFLFHHLSFQKTKGGLFLLILKGKFKLFIIFFQRMVSLMVILFITNASSLFVNMYIDLSKLKAYKLLENTDADLSWLLFKPIPTQWHLLTPLGNKPFKNSVQKGEIARNEQFFLFPQCFLPVWITFLHFRQIWNCRLQTLSVWKSLKFVVW